MFLISLEITLATTEEHVILIPWFVRLYVEIIHSLKLVDYLHIQTDKPWYNYFDHSAHFVMIIIRV